jgi:hypothetical protein
MQSAGLGDIRVLVRYWFLSLEAAEARAYVAGGLRLPTGETDRTFTATSGRVLTEDESVQLGTGNTALVLELGGFVRPLESLAAFAQARYTITPYTDTHNTSWRNELNGPPEPRKFADEDTIAWKAGVAHPTGRVLRGLFTGEPVEALDGLSFTAALSGAHVLASDLIGATGGFQRPARLVFAEPGLIWSWRRVTFAASAPITIYRYVANPTTAPDWVFQMSLTVALN